MTCAQFGKGDERKQAVQQRCLAYLLVMTLRAWVTTCSAALQRRHLMVWALFAPRFLFELSFLGIVDVSMVLFALYAVV